MREILLIDLSSLAYPIWHMSGAEPDPDAVSRKVVERVRGLATNQPFVAVCADGGRSFRKDIDPSYKATRPESDATLQHQIQLAIDTLKTDGFPVWMVKGYEADDLIASSVARAMQHDDVQAVIVSADKDLLALINGRVVAKSLKDGRPVDETAVIEKFGVKPSQIRDYLALVGDTSDNIIGAKGIGPKRAAQLLQQFDSLIGILDAKLLPQLTPNVTPALVTAINEFRPRALQVLELVTLRTDADIPFEDIWQPRVPADADDFQRGIFEDIEDAMPTLDVEPQVPLPEPDALIAAPTPAAEGASVPPAEGMPRVGRAGEISATPVELLPAPVDYTRQLDPRSMREAKQLAIDLFQSRMWNAYGNAPAVLSTIMVGRELGIPAMASLRSIHNIEGRHALSAQLMVGLILRSGLAAYFRPVRISETEATYETLRKGEGNQPFQLTHTLDMAKQAGLVKPNSGWTKNPTDMLCSRASSRLARLIYPDLIAALYTPEEISEIEDNGH